MREIEKEIEDLIIKYFSQLRSEADNGWTNAYKKAENFYCRLLNKIYGWELYNRNYYKRNEFDIDLSTHDKSISVQVTLQKDNKKGKIKNTISGFKKRKLSEGYKSLYIAFFEDLVDKDKDTELNDKSINFDLDNNIITPNAIKSYIAKFSPQKQLELISFLNQEIFPQEIGIDNIATIRPIYKAFDKVDEFHSNTKFLENNWIVLSKTEFQLYKKIQKQSKANLYEGLQNYLLIGSGCSGKTTFAYFVASQLEKQSLIKCFYLKVTESLRISDIKKELSILNNQFSFLIIDDIQENLSFSNDLYVELKDFNQIQSIFLSRDTSQIDNESNGQIYQREFIWTERYNNEIVCDDARIQELIQNRLKFYNLKFPDKKFEVGDIGKVIELINFNLLKLSILLHFWGKEGGALSSFDNDKLNDEFYNNYDFNKEDEIPLILRYASIYSYNIPFQPQLSYSDATNQRLFNQLRDKGLFYKEDSFFVFHHTTFADLLVNAIISQFPELRNKGADKVKQEQVIEYLSAIEVLPDNFGTIVQNLTENGNISAVEEILNLPKLYNPILTYYKKLNPLPYNFSNTLVKLASLKENSLLNDLLVENESAKRVIEYYSLKSYASQAELLKLVREHKQLDQNLKKSFIEIFQSKIPFQKIRIFEQSGYHLKNEILAFKEEIVQEVQIQIGFSVDNVQIRSFVNDTPLNELTLTIYQDRKNQKLTIHRLFVLDFSFWMEKFYSVPFILLGNCLTELKKTDAATQLAYDIYKNLNVDLLLQSALEDNNQPIKISKSLNELINFRAFDNNQKLDDLLGKLIADKGFFRQVAQLSLTDFARFLSDISDINKDVAISIFSSRTSNDIAEQLLKNNESLYSITQIINNLNKVTPESSIEILEKLINSDSFLSNEKLTDLNGLHEFKQCLKNYNLYLKNESNIIVNSSTIEALLNEPDLTKVAKILIGFQSNRMVLNKVFSSNQLSVANFERLGKNVEFRISHLQQILPKLIDADLELGHKVYTSLSDEYFIKPSNRTYFQGVCQAIFSFVKIDKQYSKKYQVVSTKTQFILMTLCTNRASTFLSKARSTEIDKFLIGFQQTWIVSEELTRQFLEPILIDKAKASKKENINLSTFGQGIKRLIDLDKYRYLPIAKQLFEAYRPILKQTTKNLDIRKISYGLEQLSILSSEVDQFANEISEIIIDKCKIESKREDFKTGVLPELAKALKGKNGKKIIDKVTNI